MLLKELVKITKCKNLNLLKKFIEVNSFVTINHMRKYDKRNCYIINKQVELFVKEGILLKDRMPIKTGKNKADVMRDVYKINKEHEVVKILCQI